MTGSRRKKPNIRRPGVDRSQGFGGHYEAQAGDAPKVQSGGAASDPKHTAGYPEPTPAAPEPAADANAAPESGSVAAQPDQTPSTAGSPAKPTRTDTRGATKTSAQTEAIPRGSRSETRAPVKTVALTAYPTEAHRAELEALASETIAAMDIVKLAGRRAAAKFAPSAKFQPAPDVARMGTSHRYTTTKQVRVDVLERLHDAVNPLRLKSDNQVLRGQFEPLLWAELDAVIAELKRRRTS